MREEETPKLKKNSIKNDYKKWNPHIKKEYIKNDYKKWINKKIKKEKDDWIDYSSSKNANRILSIISENFWLTSESA